jgi:hypothetical protein
MKLDHLPEYTRRVFLNRTLQALGAAATLPLATACFGEAQAAATAWWAVPTTPGWAPT